MTSKTQFTALAGSRRQPIRGAREIRNSHPDQTIEVTVRLRSKAEAALDEKKVDAARKEFRSALQKNTYARMTRADFEKAHGASPDDAKAVERFAQEYRLKVVSTDLARRTMVLAGTVSNLQRAFQVQLKEYTSPRGNFRGRVGELQVPSEMAAIVRGVFGLDNRPQAEPHFRRLPMTPGIKAHAATISHDPNEVARLYNFPAGDGSGQCVGIIELGGGFREEDLKTYFTQLGLAEPQVISVSVDGGQNAPSDPNSADGEVMLDIEVVGAIVPGAKIVVYFAPNTDRGFLDAITTAVHDSDNQPSVISISWGAPESQWTDQALTSFDEAFQSAAALGVTVCAASGDNGSSDGINDGLNHVDFPASSSFVLGCGGTELQTSGDQIVNETVWNDPAGGATGGGVSDVFDPPDWQSDANVPARADGNKGRGVPDVSGDADPATGYNILVDGEEGAIGGTSAVAPLWAAWVALFNQSAGKPIGYLNPLLYGLGDGSGFRDITEGDNGSFTAAQGWDPCTGLGSLDGAKLMAALGGKPQKVRTAA